METRLSGNAFQILAAATGKARLPTVESLKGGTTRSMMMQFTSNCSPKTLVSAHQKILLKFVRSLCSWAQNKGWVVENCYIFSLHNP